MDLKNDLSQNTFKEKEKEVDSQLEPFDLNNSQELKLDNSFDSKVDFDLQDNPNHKNTINTAADADLWNLDQNEDIVSNMIQKKLEDEMFSSQNDLDNQKKKRYRDQQEITDDDLLSIFSKEEVQKLNQSKSYQELYQQSSQFPNKKLKVLNTEDYLPQAVNVNQLNQYPHNINYAGKITEQLESRLNNLESLVAPLSKLKNNTSYMNQLQNIKNQLFALPLPQQQNFYQSLPSKNLPCQCPNCINQQAEFRSQKIQKLVQESPLQIKKEHRQLAIQKLYQRMSSIEKLLQETKTEIVQIETRNSLMKNQGNNQFVQQIKQQQILQYEKNLKAQDRKDDIDKNLSAKES